MSLPANQRLRKSKDFSIVYQGGKSFADKNLVLFANKLETRGPARIGFSISKRVGNAVVRNRTRRRLQAVMRDVGTAIVPAADLVWIVRPRSGRIGFNELRASALELLSRAGLLRGPE